MVLIVVHRLQTGAGDIVRDRCGNGVTGFGMNIDSCSISEAELWGLYQQLRIAWNRGVVQLEVELTAGITCSRWKILCTTIWVRQDHEFSWIQNQDMTCNEVADWLSKANSVLFCPNWIPVPPSDLVLLFLQDISYL
ncbi:uncharacterized protein LOC8282535 [Ricinus communis]|uniref:uncharacterized protein LOC8282535 n=1 Tax=Ricinus communis TaxID=3988 RepID=UPI00201B018F|nr:uncharacterized protein LOC8282535 [Ricinus communis]